MKMRNLFAAATAVAVVAATSVSAFAGFFGGTNADKSGSIVCLAGEAIDNPMFPDMTIPSTITAYEITMSITDEYFQEDLEAGTWFGGSLPINSDSTGWYDGRQWAFSGEASDTMFIFEPTGVEGQYSLTVDNGAPFFAATDTYAFIHIHDWSTLADLYGAEIVDYKLLNAAGEDVRIRESAGSTNTGSTEAGKGSPDTGVEGIAVAAGVAALAGAAVVVSRKRK